MHYAYREVVIFVANGVAEELCKERAEERQPPRREHRVAAVHRVLDGGGHVMQKCVVLGTVECCGRMHVAKRRMGAPIRGRQVGAVSRRGQQRGGRIRGLCIWQEQRAVVTLARAGGAFCTGHTSFSCKHRAFLVHILL